MKRSDDLDLLQQYLDGMLPDDASAAFEARLKNEAELAAQLVRMSREEAIYRDWAVSVAAASPAQPRPAPAQRRRFALAWVVAAAAIVFFVLFVSLLDRTTRPSTGSTRSLAVLEDIQGIVEVFSPDGRVEFAAPGQALYAGQEVRTGEEGSFTVLRWQNDSKLALSAETRVKLTADGVSTKSGKRQPQVFVTEGIVSADIPNNKSLIILSDHAELRNAHGRISFVSLADETFVETDAGFARLVRKSDGTMVDVHPGYFAVANKKRMPLKPNKAPPRRVKPRKSMHDNNGPIVGLFFDPEGTSLTGAAGDTIKRWDLSSGKLVWTLRPVKKKPIRTFAIARDGKSLALAIEERAVRLFDADTGEERLTYRTNKKATAAALSPDSRTLAVAWHLPKEGAEIRLYDTTLGIERLLMTGQAAPILALQFSHNGELLATAGSDRSVKLWDVKHLSLARGLGRMPQAVRTLAFSHDDRLLALGERTGAIRIVETTGAERVVLSGHLREVNDLEFSPDGQLLASASGDGTARLWRIGEGRELAAFKGHRNAVRAVAFSQDGRTLASGGIDRAVLLWDVVTLEPKK